VELAAADEAVVRVLVDFQELTIQVAVVAAADILTTLPAVAVRE
jgi:hypothetical protein